MKHVLHFILLGTFVHLFACACLQLREKVPFEVPEENENIWDEQPKIMSTLELDSQKFKISELIASLTSTNLRYELPSLSFKIPQLADYAEIIRCDANARLDLNLPDLPLSEIRVLGAKSDETFFKNNHIFEAAEKNPKCTLTSYGTLKGFDYLYDPNANSGSFVYIVRACVSESRAPNDGTTRNCSRQVGISNPIEDFTNKATKAVLKAYRAYSMYQSLLNHSTLKLGQLQVEAMEALDECETRNHIKKVNKKVRDAWIQIASAIVEVGFEIYSINKVHGNVVKHYKKLKSVESWIDRSQLFGALQGHLLSQPLILISGSDTDIPDTCTKYLKIQKDFIVEDQRAEVLHLYTQTYLFLAELLTASKHNTYFLNRLPSFEDPRSGESYQAPPDVISLEEIDLEQFKP